MIVYVSNLTETKADGTSDYEVRIILANGKEIAHFEVMDHVRTEPASVLLRKVADQYDKMVAMQKHLTPVN